MFGVMTFQVNQQGLVYQRDLVKYGEGGRGHRA
jgi:hypothetical protein